MTRRYHTIFFDVGGTLLSAAPSIGAVYVEIAARYGIVADAEEIELAARKHYLVMREGELAGHSHHTFSLEEAKIWWRRLVRASFGPAADSPRFEAFYQAVFDEFRKPERYRIYPEVEQVIARLEASGQRMGIISNWDPRLRSVLEGMGLTGRFNPIIISGEVGLEKPDPRIFQIARERAGAGPEEALLQVGDNERDDREGAHGAGFEGRIVDRDRGETLLMTLADILGD